MSLSPQAEPSSGSAAYGGVIHDLGYRRYSGARLGASPIGRSLFVTGLLNVYGIGRSGRAKALPITLLVIMTIPAVVSVAVMVVTGLDEGFINYSTYPVSTSLLIAIFVAAQSPVLFSRDLRSGAITLYLARPLSPTTYALIRWASLFVAILVFVTIPVLTLYLGAVSSGADVGEHTGDLLAAMVGIVLLAAMLATIGGLLSAFTTRRGLAIGLTIVALMVSIGVVESVKAVAEEEGSPMVGRLVGLLSPFSLEDGIQGGLLGGNSTYRLPPEDGGLAALYLVVTVLGVAGGLALLVWRYRKIGGR